MLTAFLSSSPDKSGALPARSMPLRWSRRSAGGEEFVLDHGAAAWRLAESVQSGLLRPFMHLRQVQLLRNLPIDEAMRKPSLTRLLSASLVFLLLCGQAALAFAACVSATARAADAYAQMPADCDMPDMAARAQLCLAQCLAGDQIDTDGRPAPLPAADVPVLTLPRLPAEPASGAGWFQPPTLQATGPPLSLYCSLQL